MTHLNQKYQTSYLLVMKRKKCQSQKKKVIIGMCFEFLNIESTQLTVHACDMITHLKLR